MPSSDAHTAAAPNIVPKCILFNAASGASAGTQFSHHNLFKFRGIFLI